MANAPGLRFTDGTTTVTISDGSTGWLLKYDAKNAEASRETVTEGAVSLLVGGISTVRGYIESLNKLFQQAKLWREEHVYPIVYVERLTESAGAWWRSELIEANPLPEPSAMDSGIINGKFEIQVSYTRKNYWEGAEAQIPLTNANGTNVTSGLTIYNHDDSGAGNDNWVSIAGADVAGDLPAPARVEVTNTKAGRAITKLFMGLNYTDPANFPHVLEGEASTTGTQLPGSPDTTLFSGGYYRKYTPGSTGEETAFTWAISSAMLAAGGNKWYLPILVFSGASSTDGKVRLKLLSGSTVLYSSPQVLTTEAVSAGVALMKPMRIPPWQIEASSLLALTLVMTYQSSTPGAFTAVDYVLFLPLDGFQVIDFMYGWVVNTYRIISDGIKQQVYADNGSTSRNSMCNVNGDYIYLKPGALQRLIFMWEQMSAPYSDITDTSTIKVYYRPRKLTLN